MTFITAPSGECLVVAVAVSRLPLCDHMTLKFNLLTSNEMSEQDLLCTIHLSSLVMIRPVVFVLECWHIHAHAPTHTHTYRAAERPTHAFDNTLAWVKSYLNDLHLPKLSQKYKWCLLWPTVYISRFLSTADSFNGGKFKLQIFALKSGWPTRVFMTQTFSDVLSYNESSCRSVICALAFGGRVFTFGYFRERVDVDG